MVVSQFRITVGRRWGGGGTTDRNRAPKINSKVLAQGTTFDIF